MAALISRLFGEGSLTVPLGTFFQQGELICFRTGNTGRLEFWLLAPQAFVDGLSLEAREMGVWWVGQEALDQCRLEAGLYNPRAEGQEALTALELQQGWRLSRTKAYVGSASVARERQEVVSARVSTVVGGAPFFACERLWLEGDEIGRVLHVGFAPLLGTWVGRALLKSPWHHVGVVPYRVGEMESERWVATVSTPLEAPLREGARTAE